MDGSATPHGFLKFSEFKFDEKSIYRANKTFGFSDLEMSSLSGGIRAERLGKECQLEKLFTNSLV